MFQTIMQWVRGELAQWRGLADIEALAKLSDHQLDDIGLRRDQLFMLEIRPIDQEREIPRGIAVSWPELEPCG